MKRLSDSVIFIQRLLSDLESQTLLTERPSLWCWLCSTNQFTWSNKNKFLTHYFHGGSCLSEFTNVYSRHSLLSLFVEVIDNVRTVICSWCARYYKETFLWDFLGILKLLLPNSYKISKKCFLCTTRIYVVSSDLTCLQRGQRKITIR